MLGIYIIFLYMHITRKTSKGGLLKLESRYETYFLSFANFIVSNTFYLFLLIYYFATERAPTRC